MMYHVQCHVRGPGIWTGWSLSAGAVVAVAGLFIASPAMAAIGTGSVDGGEEVFSIVHGWEWNTDGDLEGWTPASINNADVAGGLLTGESLGDGSFPAGADPIFNGPGDHSFVIGDGVGEVNRVQFAAQFDVGAPTVRTEMFFFPTAGAHESQVWAPADFPVITDGNMHVYTVDIGPADPLWGATIGSFRLDPVADNQDVVDSFAYDYLRLGSIPEPNSTALLLLGALTIGVWRRRSTTTC
jgi:hypothetical protein